VAQWVSPLRLELGHHLKPEPLRTTEFAPAIPQDHEHPCASAPFAGYGPPATATRLGKRVAYLTKTLFSSLMGRSVALLGKPFRHMNGAEKPMAVCVSCMEPASAVAVPVRCESLVNGMAVLPPNRAR
jgi:hypothetical protein